MARWRALHESIGRSRGLRGMSHHDALLYTWGLANTDPWGLVRCDHMKALVFPYRSTTAGVEAGLERLIAAGKLCLHHHNGHAYVHWCFFEEYQGEVLRKRRGTPPFPFTCHNDSQIRNGGTRGVAAERAEYSAYRTDTDTEPNRHRQPSGGKSAAGPPSLLMQAVMAIWPGAGAVFFQGYTDLEDEYGPDFMWECWRAALESGQTKPSVRYLEAIARRCKAEGREPLERQELQDVEPEDNRPTEIDGIPVIGWAAGLPILDAAAKAT